MRSVMVMDSTFARRERTLVSRLEIGLADEGVRVAHAVPWGMAAAESVGLYSVTVGYVERGLPFTLRQRAGMLQEQLREAMDLDDRDEIEIVHAMGDGFRGAWAGGTGSGVTTRAGAWAMSFELARELRAGLVLEVWSSALIGQATAMLAKARAHGVPLLVLCPEEAIALVARSRMPSAEIVVAPWGVHSARESRAILSDQTVPAIALVADGVEPRMLQAIMEGISRLTPGPRTTYAGDDASKATAQVSPPLPCMLFVGAEDRAAASVWRLARKLRILDRTTLVPDMEGHRDPTLAMDILVVPGGTGVQRTFVLDAMAAGLAIVSGGDTLIPYLNDSNILAKVANPSDAGAWAETISSLIADPQRARSLGAASRAWVREHRAASGYVSVVLKAYDTLAAKVKAARPGVAAGSAA